MRECELCGRSPKRLTKHHLIPRARHGNKRNKKHFSRHEVYTRIIKICRPCHNNIHAVFSNKELERDYNTIEKLREHPDIIRFTDWIKTKPVHLSVSTRPKRDRDIK